MVKVGNVIGVLGLVVCLLAVVGRFVNEPSLFSFQAINVYMIGVGLVAAGCFAKLSGR